MKNHAIALLIIGALNGCASIVSGTTQSVAINSTAGARYAVIDRNGAQVAAGNTPAQVDLNRGMGYFKTGSYKINIRKPGYHPRTIDISPSVNGWYWANLAIPGNLWWMLIVDPSTGAMYKLNPDSIDAPLEPNGDPLDADGNLVSSLKSDGKVSIHDYQAQQVAKSMKCSIFGNGSLQRQVSGADLITYQCHDNRLVRIECSNRNGCSPLP